MAPVLVFRRGAEGMTSHTLPNRVIDKDVEHRVRRLIARLQVLTIQRPQMAVYLLGIVERFVDRALPKGDA